MNDNNPEPSPELHPEKIERPESVRRIEDEDFIRIMNEEPPISKDVDVVPGSGTSPLDRIRRRAKEIGEQGLQGTSVSWDPGESPVREEGDS